MKKGYIHVYTGNGKGKTTAALGLALRAAGAGLRVFIAQFIKSRRCSEHRALERFKDLITVKLYGTGFIKGKEKEEIRAARRGLEEVRGIIHSGDYEMVILDEINIATHSGLISTEDLLDLIENKPSRVELVLTGRYADARIIKKADLVTEMKDIKHYYKQGVRARKGIEK